MESLSRLAEEVRESTGDLAGKWAKSVRTDFSIAAFKLSLRMMGVAFAVVPRLRREILNEKTGFTFNASYQFSTRDGEVDVYAVFSDGKMRSGTGRLDNPDVTISYRDKETLAALYNKSPEESLDYILTNDMSCNGNMSYLMKFSYLTTLLKGARIRNGTGPGNRVVHSCDPDRVEARRQILNTALNRKVDAVQHLDDPYLSRYTLEDFPRLKRLKYRRYALRPALCIERARLVTEHHRQNGFEADSEGNVLSPELRQARAMNHVLRNKVPRIYDDDLMAGSTTSKELGVPIYPELVGLTIWPELRTVAERDLNPYDITSEDAELLNMEVFPFWTTRNVREYCRKRFGNPVSQRLEERFVLYFMMKNNAISHTVPDFPNVLAQGLAATAQEAGRKEKKARKAEKKEFYRALQIAVEGVLAYAENLAAAASSLADALEKKQPAREERISELREIARICRKVPAGPAETVHEGLLALWICFTALHQENANSALSIGRLDSMLNPLFLREMEAARDDAERERIVRRAIELVGCFFLRLNDHDPMIPSVGNKLFGGTSSDDTVTVGGVNRDGTNAVNDMTYVILKTAEMLGLQDPNLNARYHREVNSAEYLQRLCEVNMNMKASPSIHNDACMIEALQHQGIPLEDARDWAATGCVEPTIAGRHYGHTNCMLLNMVAPLEMALNNGVHPLVGEQVGPATGDPRVAGAFATYEDFLAAYKEQLRYLAEQSIEINNFLGLAHQYVHPTPVLSAMTTGPLDKGMDVVCGGAVYNTSGVALVSITDVVDSLMVIKKLVYGDHRLDFAELMKAVDGDFSNGNGRVGALIRTIPTFGSHEPETTAVARDLIDFIYDIYQGRENYRGGRYLPGYWSISFHVGFGILSGALPSGRKKGMPFTPGLTPAPGDSDQLLENIHTVAGLDHLKMPNNIAFNVKIVPDPASPHEKNLDDLTAYVKSYFDQGGMQWQFNVISSDTMRAAMEAPDDYRWLIVRISGYNANFVNLNRDMQMELVRRTEYRTRG